MQGVFERDLPKAPSKPAPAIDIRQPPPDIEEFSTVLLTGHGLANSRPSHPPAGGFGSRGRGGAMPGGIPCSVAHQADHHELLPPRFFVPFVERSCIRNYLAFPRSS